MPITKSNVGTKPNATEQVQWQAHAADAAISILRNEGDAKAQMLALFVLLVKAGTLTVKPSQTKEGAFVLRQRANAAETVAALVETHLATNPDRFTTIAWDNSALVESFRSSNLTRLLAAQMAYAPEAMSCTAKELLPYCRTAIVSMGGLSPVTAGAKLLQSRKAPTAPTAPTAPKLPKADDRTSEQHELFLAQQFTMLQQYATKFGISATKVTAARKAAGIK